MLQWLSTPIRLAWWMALHPVEPMKPSGKIRGLIDRVAQQTRHSTSMSVTVYEPTSYWESRAARLIEEFDSPERWSSMGWISNEVEEGMVPELLRAAGVASVLVVGAGSGREYRYLLDSGFQVSGIDISPTLVAECRKRFPQIHTLAGSVLDLESLSGPVDAVVTSTVLQHVPPADIQRAMDAVSALARRMICIRETTEMSVESAYQWVHDFVGLLPGWTLTERIEVGKSAVATHEVLAWRPSPELETLSAFTDL